MSNAAVNSVYQSPVMPVRRFSTDAIADKENNPPVDVNRLKKLLKKSSDESRDVLALLKNGTTIKVCKPLANIDKNTLATQIPVRARKPAPPKDAEESQTSTKQTSVQAAKPKGAIKKTTIAKAKEGADENQKPKRVRKPKEATAKKVTIIEPETSGGHASTEAAKPKGAIKKTTIAEAKEGAEENQKPMRVRKPKEATAKKVTITEPETSVGHNSAEAKPKRVYKKRVTAKSKEESADNQKLQNEATKNIKEGNKIDQKKAPTLESSNLNNLNIKSEPAMQHNKSSNSKFNLSDPKVKKETAVKKPNCAVAKKLNTTHEKTVKKLNTAHEKTAKKLNTTHEKTAKKLNTTHDKIKKLTSSEDAGLKISKQHITFCKEKSKQAKGKKDKKARDKFKNDIKVAEAIEEMARYFSNSNNVTIGNVAVHLGHCLSSSSSECLSDCSCNNESLSSSDHTHCNCWNCQLKSSSDDSSWTKTSSDSSDNSDDSEATSSTESSSSSSSSSSDDSKKRSKRSEKSCKKYNLRNRRK